MMEWVIFLTALEEAVREYEERTFADWMDGGYDMYATDDYDMYATDEGYAYDE